MPETNRLLTYIEYTYDETRESIERQFIRRIGYAPAAIFKSANGSWLAGPVLMVTTQLEFGLQPQEAMA